MEEEFLTRLISTDDDFDDDAWGGDDDADDTDKDGDDADDDSDAPGEEEAE